MEEDLRPAAQAGFGDCRLEVGRFDPLAQLGSPPATLGPGSLNWEFSCGTGIKMEVFLTHKHWYQALPIV